MTEFTSGAIADIDTPPQLDPRLANFIDSYARFCADLFLHGVVPPADADTSFVKQYFRVYKHKPRRTQPIQKNPTKRGT